MKRHDKDELMTRQERIAILERILSYAEFKKKHLPDLKVMADKLKKLKDEPH